ncbi:EscU/YscU/HrcU family type III secretion system export apparatus switch protein [Candidatus Thalassolituus haligoni]|jgi:flagellar biosynthesis protein|uniref:EscU/YscU/HrcU family type III secretion system export apparatus switch protein n=1 Tax=Candidatus Thalassolituus haligoni TaxID=3100113 RepID=UPI00351358D2|tara:strand:+ start:10294 stop:10584 length:291 start_codon:yes stop_codon:yes gene_type:complete
MSIPDSLKQANQAIALSYQPEQTGTPRISASGEDELAQAIIELALAHQVPVYENAALTRWLGQMAVGDEIPEPLYQVIAEILAVVYQLQGKTPDGS